MNSQSIDPKRRALPPFPKILDGSTESTSAVLSWAGEAAQLIIDLRDAISELEHELDDHVIAAELAQPAPRKVEEIAPVAPRLGAGSTLQQAAPSASNRDASNRGAFESAWASEPEIDAAAADRFFETQSSTPVNDRADSVDAFQAMLGS